MGKKKLASISRIADKNSRNVTYCKRKRGLIKKAIELSKLCEQYVYMVIFDKENQTVTEYRSSMNFDLPVVSRLVNSKSSTNLKHKLICGQKLMGKKLADLDSEFDQSAEENTSTEHKELEQSNEVELLKLPR